MIWLITGIGRGLGSAVAAAALARGDTVVGIVRDQKIADAFTANAPGRSFSFLADVTDRAAVFEAITQTIETVGVPDIIINNAGQVLEAYVEEADPDTVRSLMEVNLMGPLNLIQAILPHLRARGSGKIGNVSSAGGLLAVPTVGLYSASKFALEGMSEALAQEVDDQGIRVTLIEPGAFRTEFMAKSRTNIASSIPAYGKSMGKIRQSLSEQEPSGDPEKLAQAILTWADSNTPPMRLVLGDDAIGMALHKAKSIQRDIENWRSVGSGLAFDH